MTSAGAGHHGDLPPARHIGALGLLRKNVSWEEPGDKGQDVAEHTAMSLLEQARRDAALLSAVIGKDGVPMHFPAGHRTVSSTQLAQATSLTASQKMEVAEMVRRQENLRQQTINDYEQQLQVWGADLERADQLRLQDNRAAETEMKNALASWNAERVGLQPSPSLHTTFIGASGSQRSPHGHLSNANAAAAGPTNQSLSFGGGQADGDTPMCAVLELHKKLQDGQVETDALLQRVLEIDEVSYTWCVKESGPHAVSALSEKLTKELTLVAEVATIDQKIADQLWTVLATDRLLQETITQALVDNLALRETLGTTTTDATVCKQEAETLRTRICEMQQTLDAAQQHAEEMEAELNNFKVQCSKLESYVVLEKTKCAAAETKFAEVRRQISLRARREQREMQGFDSHDEQPRQLPPSIWVELDQNPSLFVDGEPPVALKEAVQAHDDSDDGSNISLGFGMPRRNRISPHDSGNSPAHNVRHAQHLRTMLTSRAGGATLHDGHGHSELAHDFEDVSQLEHVSKPVDVVHAYHVGGGVGGGGVWQGVMRRMALPSRFRKTGAGMKRGWGWCGGVGGGGGGGGGYARGS